MSLFLTEKETNFHLFYNENRPDFDKIVYKLKEKMKEDKEVVETVLIKFLHENDMQVIETQVMNMSIQQTNEEKNEENNSKKKKKKKEKSEKKAKKGKDASKKDHEDHKKLEKTGTKSAVKSLKKFATLSRSSIRKSSTSIVSASSSSACQPTIPPTT